ncbi:MAG: HNH endonuclease [Candidatus Marinimicrobia bacterium]|nr:HNH endonuclease [Candidatus Neomarinimicrobiota bacterium]
MDKIFITIGLPEKCFFEDKFCRSDFGRKRVFKLDFGHKVPFKKGGSITDVNNILWLCRRHNFMMGDRTFDEFRNMVDSMLKNYD